MSSGEGWLCIARAAVDPDVLEHIGWDGDAAPGADPTLVH